jgi:hypothetical protein
MRPEGERNEDKPLRRQGEGRSRYCGNERPIETMSALRMILLDRWPHSIVTAGKSTGYCRVRLCVAVILQHQHGSWPQERGFAPTMCPLPLPSDAMLYIYRPCLPTQRNTGRTSAPSLVVHFLFPLCLPAHFNNTINKTKITISTTIVVTPQFSFALLPTVFNLLLAPSNRP